MSRRNYPWLLLILFLLVVFGHGLTAGPLYRTEGLRALVAEEMLRSGQPLIPHLGGNPLLTKPPLGYAAMVLASLPFGAVLPATARVPSVLAAGVTVLLVMHLFHHAFRAREVALLAGFLLPCALFWLPAVPGADLDIQQLAWVALSLGCLYRAVCAAEEPAPDEEGRHSPGWQEGVWWALALLSMTGGVLTKWTAPLFFYATAIPFLWLRGQLRLLVRLPHLGALLLGGGLALGWAAWTITHVGWETFRSTVGGEAITKLVPGQRAVGYPWHEILLHPLEVLGACLPAALVIPWTWRRSFAASWPERPRRLLQLFHCWAWPALLFWCLVPVHTVRHSLPLLPALLGLSGFVWIGWLRGKERWPLAGVAPRTVLVGMVVAWLAVKVIYTEVIVPRRGQQRHPEVKGAALAAQVPPHTPLYYFRLKDETLLYYAARQVIRLSSPQAVPAGALCLLTEEEWQQWSAAIPAVEKARLQDVQGAPLYLIQIPCQHLPD